MTDKRRRLKKVMRMLSFEIAILSKDDSSIVIDRELLFDRLTTIWKELYIIEDEEFNESIKRIAEKVLSQ
jgi:muramidase (phage lysozyme)